MVHEIKHIPYLFFLQTNRIILSQFSFRILSTFLATLRIAILQVLQNQLRGRKPSFQYAISKIHLLLHLLPWNPLSYHIDPIPYLKRYILYKVFLKYLFSFNIQSMRFLKGNWAQVLNHGIIPNTLRSVDACRPKYCATSFKVYPWRGNPGTPYLISAARPPRPPSPSSSSSLSSFSRSPTAPRCP